MNLKQLPVILTQLILVFILTSVNLDTLAQSKRPAVPLRIDFEAIVKQDISLNLSEIVDDIEYIALETKKECLIGEVDAIRIFKDQVFLLAQNQVFKFNKKGKFISTIGSGGKGPGEFVKPIDIQIDEGTNSIFVLDQTLKKIHEYSTDGEYRKSITLAIPGFPWQILCFENSLLIFNQILPPMQIQLYRIDHFGRMIFKFPMRCELKSSREGLDYASFNKNARFFDYTSAWNDTIFRIYENNQLELLYIIDYGKYKYPLKGKNAALNQSMIKEYVYQLWRSITTRYLFFYYSYMWDDRLAVFDTKIPGFIFNGSLVDKNADHRGLDDLNAGIRNDIDGGRNLSRILPFMFTNGNELVKAIDAMDMIESMNTKKAGELNPKYAHKRKAFMELAKKLKEDDNPVIQVLHLK